MKPFIAPLLPAVLAAQLQIYVENGGREQRLPPLYDAGSAAPGDVLDIRLRVRNAGSAAESVRTIEVAGAGFARQSAPPLPYLLAPGAALDFTVRFRPAATGYHSASVAVNGVTHILYATAAAAASVFDDRRLLTAGAVIDFGKLERGASASRILLLENRNAQPLRIGQASISGGAFAGPFGVTFPLTLEPGKRAEFEIRFSPAVAGGYAGLLQIDGRGFVLAGTGLEIPLPRPLLYLESTPAVSSATQVRLTISLAETPRTAGTGELRLDFRSGVPGVATDPGILFLPAATRFLTFQVREGETEVQFSGRDFATFQTGTTAGVIELTARLGDHSERLSLPIAPAPVQVEALQALRTPTQLEIHLTAWDNLRTASQLAFTLYDRHGAVVAPGAQRVDAAADFRRYFESSAVGGAFLLRAVLPVTGKSAEIAEAELEVSNSAGTTRPARIRIP